MKKFILLFLATFLLYNLCHAQCLNVSLSSNRASNNSVEIRATVKGYGSYTAFVKFSRLENATCENEITIPILGSGTVYTMRPLNPQKPIIYGYTYRIVRGLVDPKVKTDFVYRLPYSTTKTTRVKSLGNFSEKHFGGSNTENWHSYQFILEKGDTVFAARKGIVVQITDEHDTQDLGGEISMSSKQNQVLVEHADGSIARYGVLEKENIFVKEGETVYPNTPVGLAGSYDGIVYQLRFSVFYRTKNKSSNPKFENSPTSTAYIEPIFATTNGNTTLNPKERHTPVINNEILTKEFSKKELKKWEKKTF